MLSVFKSLNEEEYGKVLRIMFELRDKRLKIKARNPPLMMQSMIVKKLRKIYYGDKKTSIIPINIKKCR